MIRMKLLLAFLCTTVLLSACRTCPESDTKSCNAVEIAAVALSCMPTNAPFADDFSIHVRKCNNPECARGIHLSKNTFKLEVLSDGAKKGAIGSCHISCDSSGVPIYAIWEKNEEMNRLVKRRETGVSSYCALALSLYANSSPRHEFWNASISVTEDSDGIAVFIQDLDKIGFESPLYVFKNGYCHYTLEE